MAKLPYSAQPPSPDLKRKFACHIRALGLQHFWPPEFLVGVGATSGGVRNGMPPDVMWDNVVPTALVADLARHRHGSPIEITSAYRHKGYNEEIGGADQSQHRSFRALDLAPQDGEVEALYEIITDLAGERISLPVEIDPIEDPTPADYGPGGLDVQSDSFRFKGGVGLYPEEGFVHVDTRGNTARW